MTTPLTSLCSMESRERGVAEIVQLKPNQSPLGDTCCVVVTRNSSGEPEAEGPFVEHSTGATFYVPHVATEVDRNVAIAKAQAWADQHGIATVYVQE